MESTKPRYPKVSCSQEWKMHLTRRGGSAAWQPEGGEPGMRG